MLDVLIGKRLAFVNKAKVTLILWKKLVEYRVGFVKVSFIPKFRI